MPPPWRTWAAADSCALCFATHPSLNHLANPNGGHNHNLSKKTMHTHMSSGYWEVLFWNLLVCRGMNENACIFSVLKSTGCISTCSCCLCKLMCACIQLYECMGLWNLHHPFHIIRALIFKKKTEVIKVLLRRNLWSVCTASHTKWPSCCHHQIRSAMTLSTKSWKPPRMEMPCSSEQPGSGAALPFSWRSFYYKSSVNLYPLPVIFPRQNN